MTSRISTQQQFIAQLKAMQNQQARLEKLQNQISSGKKFEKPSDDVVATTRANTIQVYQNRLASFESNISLGLHDLTTQETALTEGNNLLVRVRELQIQAVNGAVNENDRASIAGEMQGLQSSLLNISNLQDEHGSYIFSGSKSRQAAFIQQGDQFTYQGDSLEKQLPIAPGRIETIGTAGSRVFTDGNDNVFQTIQTMIDILNSDNFNDSATQQAFSDAAERLDQFSEKFIDRISMIGTTMNIIGQEDQLLKDLQLQNESTLADLEGADLLEVVSQLTQETTLFEISQRTFVRLQQTSLMQILFGG